MIKPQTPLEWARSACDSLMTRFEPHMLPPANAWHYHQGVYLYSMIRYWEQAGGDRYYQYVKDYVDLLIDERGNLIFRRDELDSMQAGLLLFTLDRNTADPRYKIAADKLMNILGTLNQTSEGGYWHKDKYPNQMWLDGLYMGGVFAVEYSYAYDQPIWLERVLYQEKLMRTYMHDDKTGLLYHAWDESKKMPWANPLTGCSPEFWGRSVGWYGMAIVDILDRIPESMQGREQLIASLGSLIQALAQFQDQDSGLWYQVLDKGDHHDNWLETSCSCLFIYTIAKAIADGYIGKEYVEVARKGYKGMLKKLYYDENELLVMPAICIGTSAGDFENYITRPVSENDLHGVGAFVLACVEISKIV
ncbi:MAG: glycoside hydrolase family 88 protein [Paenibacillaceae bacterium]